MDRLKDIKHRYGRTLEEEYSLNVSDTDFEWLISIAELADKMRHANVACGYYQVSMDTMNELIERFQCP